jgi:alpha/beta superfamily hydrolase
VSSNVVSIWSKGYGEKVDLKQDIQYIHSKRHRNIRQEMVKGYMKMLSK